MNRNARIAKPVRAGVAANGRRPNPYPNPASARRRPPSPSSTDSGAHSGDRRNRTVKAEKRLVPTLHEIAIQTDQVSSNIESEFVFFGREVRNHITELYGQIRSLEDRSRAASEMEREIGKLKRQIHRGQSMLDDAVKEKKQLQQEVESLQHMMRKVVVFINKQGVDAKSVSDCSADEMPRHEVDNYIGRLRRMEPIPEIDKNSTRDSILLSESEESAEGSRYNLRSSHQQTQHGFNQSRGRRSRSANMNRSRSRSRRRNRRNSCEPNKENADVVASTEIYFSRKGEPSKAVATLTTSDSRGKRASGGLEGAHGDAKRVKQIVMDLQHDHENNTPSAPPAQNTSGGVLASLIQTPSMARPYVHVETPPSALTNRRPETMKHAFFQKNPGFMKTLFCQICAKTLKKGTYKCSHCGGMCHDTCRDRMAEPCFYAPKEVNFPMNELRAWVSSTSPMLPAIVVHCIWEVEHRGLNELGLYRVNGSQSKVEELYNGYVAAVKNINGVCYPPICREAVPEITVICSLLKHFFKSLSDNLIPAKDCDKFIAVCNVAPQAFDQGKLMDLIRALPRVNRDVLTYVILHLQRVARTDAVKMPVSNLAKVFAPTFVGLKTMDAISTNASFSVMEALINTPEKFFAEVFNDGIVPTTYRKPTSSIFTSGGGSVLGPIHGTSRVRQLQQATKSKVFSSPFLCD